MREACYRGNLTGSGGPPQPSAVADSVVRDDTNMISTKRGQSSAGRGAAGGVTIAGVRAPRPPGRHTVTSPGARSMPAVTSLCEVKGRRGLGRGGAASRRGWRPAGAAAGGGGCTGGGGGAG
ncbi:protein FAM98B-like [Schistocerca cancellata]|uniref:protein FAM98B-like n=1 Tax=Schistocerca cancellata TaxID=274614 RepID=UPI002118E7A0|nr:protein FAM98B-like [Schistocerca cancellata]